MPHATCSCMDLLFEILDDPKAKRRVVQAAPNVSDHDRRFMINSYMRAADSDGRGEWAFRGGESVPLGSEEARGR
jgi:hypothetical protein